MYLNSTKIKVILFIIILSFLSCNKNHSNGHKKDHHHGEADNRPADLSLPDDIREVFKREMRLIQDGILNIKEAIDKKDAAAGEEIALKIKDSYILNQDLTSQQQEILDRSLPEEFLKLDIEFHNKAGDLAASFKKKDFTKARVLEKKMHESCMLCHTKYMKTNL